MESPSGSRNPLGNAIGYLADGMKVGVCEPAATGGSFQVKYDVITFGCCGGQAVQDDAQGASKRLNAP